MLVALTLALAKLHYVDFSKVTLLNLTLLNEADIQNNDETVLLFRYLDVVFSGFIRPDTAEGHGCKPV